MTTNTAEHFNPTSLKLVQNELVATIETAAGRLERFAADTGDGELLQHCIEDIKQIRGTLNLLQLRGVDALANELVEHITDIPLGEGDATCKKLEPITSIFFILPRYLEYCTQTGRSMAVLLIPHINDLRIARGEPPLPMSYYYHVDLASCQRPAPKTVDMPEDFRHFVRRIRHMYQVAMLSVFQGKQVKPSMGMLVRALERLDSVTAGRPMAQLWWVGAEMISAMAEGKLQLTKARKMLLGAIDREFKRVQFEGDSVLDRSASPALLQELIYLVALSHSDSPRAGSILAAYNVSKLPYNEVELLREQEYLKGPSATTVSSMTAVLQEELRATKNILERAAQGGAEMLAETPELPETLTKIAEILSIVGLVAPSDSLRTEIDKIASWQDGRSEASADDLLAVADTLLYIESTVSGLARMSLSDEKLAALNALSRDEVLSSSHIHEAEELVINEAESGLAMIKRALNSYSESNYDIGHIKNVSSTLSSVRGGMLVLSLPRAAKVVAACEAFVNESLLGTEQLAAVQHLLETFADAVISLEYYLDAIKTDKSADTEVLQIAEESLQALGYPVAP